VVASATEHILDKYIAPEVVSRTGKVSIIFLYLVFTAVCVHGFISIRTLFTFDLFVSDDFRNFGYVKAKNEFQKPGLVPATYIEVAPDLNFYDEETQLK